MLTLGQARRHPAILSALNADADDPFVVTMIDRAVDTLMVKGDWEGTVQEYCFYTCDRCIFVPEEIQGIRGVDIDCRPRRVFGRTFDYLAASPGRCGYKANALTDRGVRAIITQPNAAGIVVVATRCENPGAYVDITARNSAGMDITQERDGVQHRNIHIDLSGGPVSKIFEGDYAQIVHVAKSPTVGEVMIFAYDPDTKTAGNLVTQMRPEQTTPAFRVFEVSHVPTGQEADVRILAKRKHVPLYDDGQVLAIGDAEAIGYMVRSLMALDAQDYRSKAILENSAVGRLNEEKADVEDGQEVRMNIDPGLSLGGFKGIW